MYELEIGAKKDVRVTFGEDSFQCNPLVVNDLIAKFREESEDDNEFWSILGDWVQSQCGSLADMPSLDQLLQFNDSIIEIANQITEDHKKKVDSIAYLRPSIQESPTTTSTGTVPPSEPGLKITEAAAPESSG